jgi:hypothetical protein
VVGLSLEIFRNALSLLKINSDEQESNPYDFGRLGKIA